MPVNKSSNSKLCGWLTWCLFVRFSQSVVCQRIGMSLSLHRLSLTVMFEWTHFSSDWHHTVNQCLQKLSSTHTHTLCYQAYAWLCRVSRHLALFLPSDRFYCTFQRSSYIFADSKTRERERKATRKPKSTESDSQISYRKMCFQFSPSFTLDACFLVWQTSSQSNIILFAHSVLDAVGWHNTVDAGVEAPFSNITKNVGSNETERHGEN